MRFRLNLPTFLILVALALYVATHLPPKAKKYTPFNLARCTMSGMELQQIDAALQRYHLLNHRYPADFERFLLESFDAKYKKVTHDSWGKPYRFIPNDDGTEYFLLSAGPDKFYRTADDLWIYHKPR